jgi:hypothetical protein
MHSLCGHMGIWWPEVEVNKEDPAKLKAGGIERTEEGELPQGRGERAWLPNSFMRKCSCPSLICRASWQPSPPRRGTA